MRMKLLKHGKRQRGLTMVEVLAALVILGSLLTAIVTAATRSSRQWARADRKLQAVVVADQLLEQWWADPKTMPRQDTGDITDDSSFRWRTQVIPNRELEKLDTEIIRLEMFDQRPEAVSREPIVAVELILPTKQALNHDASQ